MTLINQLIALAMQEQQALDILKLKPSKENSQAVKAAQRRTRSAKQALLKYQRQLTK